LFGKIFFEKCFQDNLVLPISGKTHSRKACDATISFHQALGLKKLPSDKQSFILPKLKDLNFFRLFTSTKKLLFTVYRV